jgi:ABC-type branched-subunit amino acid transport system substrate-binding protein
VSASRTSAPLNFEDPVCTVPLSRVPDNGTSAERPVVQRPVRSREARRNDWLRPGVATTALAVAIGLVAALVHVIGLGKTPPSSVTKPVPRATDTWCPRVDTGERVGLTDGSDQCDLANGLYAEELRSLEARLGRQNAEVDRTKPYRTLVFFAPLSVGSASRRTVPTGFQMLRGALLAQRDVNHLQLNMQMPVRLLVANAGEYFKFGSHGGLNTKNHSRLDVARMIINRVRRDHIAGVIGLAQSRPESLQAATELNDQGIPVLGTGVSGQQMVQNSPVSYTQLSAPDERVAGVMASFARRSPRLVALAKATAGHTAPAAVLVFDPKDTYFSVDLKDRFTHAYGSAGPVYPVPYGEARKQSQTHSVAASICALIRSTGGFILYAGRSSVMYDLFYYLQNDKQCHTHQGQIAVLAESPAPHLIQHPELMAQQYSSLHLFYSQSGLPDGKAPFAATFKQEYHVPVDSDAAGGYDAVKVYFLIMNDIMDTDPQFTPNTIITYFQTTGLTDFVGESGIITFGKGHKYPVNKEVDIQEITSKGTTINALTCGAVEAKAAPVTRWGPSRNFICPSDD